MEFAMPDVQHTITVDNNPVISTLGESIPLGPAPLPNHSASGGGIKVVPRRGGNAGSRLVTSAANLLSGTPLRTVHGDGTVYPHRVNSPITISRPATSLLRDTAGKMMGTPGSDERKRFHTPDFEYEYDTEKRQRRDKSGGRGLRHFSMKVCEKVQEKGITTYNEVADELVAEVAANEADGDTNVVYDQKNIRRRVYDALNVLMAMNIISKDRKEISWIGLPTNPNQEVASLQQEIQRTGERLAMKKRKLFEMLVHYITMRNLTDRNRNLEAHGKAPDEHTKIPLPFIIINTDEKTKIDCNISSDKHEYLFNFDNAFEIYDDIEVAKRIDSLSLGLHRGKASEDAKEKAKSLLAHQFYRYIDQLADSGIPSGVYASYFDKSSWHHKAAVPSTSSAGGLKSEGNDDDDDDDNDDEDSRSSLH